MSNVKISKETQEVIDYVLKHESEIKFKICPDCGRNLPKHDWFYQTVKNRKGKYVYEGKCKECKSLSYSNGAYKFYNMLDKYWYYYHLEEIKQLSKIMDDKQLANHYNREVYRVEHVLYKILKINSKTRINNLTKDEVIQIYKNVVNGERNFYPNGLFTNYQYNLILLEYLIEEKLKWSKQDLLDNFNFSTLDNNNLYGLRKDKKFINIVDLINNIYNTDYKIWQFKKSNVSDYFSDTIKIKEAQDWFKEKIKTDNNIVSIYDAYRYGLVNLVRDYDLYGLVQKKFNNNYYLFYEEIFNEKFDINFYKETNYPFKISITPISLSKNNIVYNLTDKYCNLDNIGKTLINDIIKYCEINNHFPTYHDLLIKDGYISYAYFKKYFNNMENINKYIYGLDIKPEKMICKDCKEEMPFTEEFFVVSKNDRYNLLYQCKKCNSKMARREVYKKRGIIFDEISDIDPIRWWEYLYNNTITKMPDFCYSEENVIKIIRYVFLDKLNLKNKQDILNTNNYNTAMNTELKLNGIYAKFSSKHEMFKKCFPEFNLTDEDFNLYNDENTNKLINEWVKENKLTIIDLLKNSNTALFDQKLNNMYVTRFRSVTDLFLWYFDYNNIKHPKHKKDITVYDFRHKPEGFWGDKIHRITAIRNYCENICKVNINEVKYDNILLRQWIKKYFNNQKISKIFTYTKHVDSLYDLLVEAYSEIKEQNILFRWEWQQVKNGQFTKEYLIICLRELVLYRMNDLIKNVYIDLPKYLNNTYISYIYPKFNNHKKDYFNSYYEWACLSFPEYADKWTPNNFGNTYAFDGVKCDSIQEKIVYEFIKKDLNFKYVKSTGKIHKGNHIVKVDKKLYGFSKCCPDFIIESIFINNKKIKLNKPIYIEYYGMYNPNNPYQVFINYVKKTHLKNKIYNSLDNILFIDLYPEDLKNNLQGVRDKLSKVLNSENLVA